MLRSNLSTRPFYNERGVQLVLALAGVLVLALTAFNVTRIISLSRQNTELSSSSANDREEAARLRREATAIRSGINQAELKTIVAAVEEANTLIDQRTFSWTEFFNRIEETLPADVMLSDVQPSFREGQTIITMTALGRRTEDVDEFIEKLEGTGHFADVLPKQHDLTEDGLARVQLIAVYRGGADAPQAQASSAAGGAQ